MLRATGEKSGRLIYPYYKLTWKDARLVWRSNKTTARIGIECLMVAWVFFNWRVGRRPIWLRLALLHWPKCGCSNVQHLKTQICVKRLEIFNERTPPPAPRWHAVLMDPHPTLRQLVCQGAVGAGCSLGAGGTMLPLTRAQPGSTSTRRAGQGWCQQPGTATAQRSFSRSSFPGSWHHHRAGRGGTSSRTPQCREKTAELIGILRADSQRILTMTG